MLLVFAAGMTIVQARGRAVCRSLGSTDISGDVAAVQGLTSLTSLYVHAHAHWCTRIYAGAAGGVGCMYETGRLLYVLFVECLCCWLWQRG